MIKAPQSLINLAHEVTEWMDGQRDTQFPFCDTYLMWNYSTLPDMETYNCTLPYWRKHAKTIMEDISTTGTFRETIARIVVVKGTAKGICIPHNRKARETHYVIKGNPACLLSKYYMPLCNCLEVNDYKLYSFDSKNIVYTPTIEGRGYSSGNLYYQNVHLSEGDIIVYVRYHDK